MTSDQKNAAKRVLMEQRASRALKVEHLTKTFGERMTKDMAAEVAQMMGEVEAIDLTVALIDAA